MDEKGQQPERETIRDVLFGQSPSSMFANWRIPKRLSGAPEDARIGDHVDLEPPAKAETPRLVRQSTPSRGSPKVFTPKPRLSASDGVFPRASPIQRSKTTMDMPSSPRKAQSVLREMQAVKLEEWQKRMPDVDRRLLEKVLRLQERDSTGLRQSLKGTLLPDACRTVERWLETASEQERQVALRFFSSLAGNRLMGGDKDEQTARLQQVVNTLQNPSSCRTPGMGLSPRGDGEDSPRRFKYVQQLDDETRQQRWMHTTWHHLPNYRLINPVVNMSSHYIKPHAHQHRHFVIHPDWG
ncbi:hypothetical protein BaRGS_00017120 [Batillaria attramentaria]|uniref:Uncharacterized protein n=1 Tax=Batillaria attramentaria TaxID=370345 RepID=A0ABD0KY04_9CAEN